MGADHNALERRARELVALGRHRDALAIYYTMADGDPSLDGGYLGVRLAECHEARNEPQAARYWYARALEENPGAWPEARLALDRLSGVTIAPLLA